MWRADFVESSAVLAAVLEVSAPKLGNVSPFSRGKGMRFEHFLASSAAIGPEMRKMAEGEFSLGQGIFHAVNRSISAQKGGNVHLGIILLFGPIASAAGSVKSLDLASLRREISEVIDEAGYEDTVYVYNAIKHANPGGVPEEVLNESMLKKIIDRRIPLKEWMADGKDQNLIAQEYCNGYDISFETALPVLLKSYEKSRDIFAAITTSFLEVLSKYQDTLIFWKFGEETAREVSERAKYLLKTMDSGEMEEFDRYLRGQDINPGTTADIVGSALFLGIVSGEITL